MVPFLPFVITRFPVAGLECAAFMAQGVAQEHQKLEIGQNEFLNWVLVEHTIHEQAEASAGGYVG